MRFKKFRASPRAMTVQRPWPAHGRTSKLRSGCICGNVLLESSEWREACAELDFADLGRSPWIRPICRF